MNLSYSGNSQKTAFLSSIDFLSVINQPISLLHFSVTTLASLLLSKLFKSLRFSEMNLSKTMFPSLKNDSEYSLFSFEATSHFLYLNSSSSCKRSVITYSLLYILKPHALGSTNDTLRISLIASLIAQGFIESKYPNSFCRVRSLNIE